ncbi:unannotated protein [freshwater metagenome]|uniref:Unannotated protein n=1 Tax=freshwater metagenome TaxID=449393 RepID=A0A6J7NWY2_9ZZZZ|nr:hypothetical protein [Actinomycetota bacterium]MSY47964.1 hypothetical protein [Actinomycetota bacterium]
MDIKYCSDSTIKKLQSHFNLFPSTARTISELRSDLIETQSKFLQCGLGIKIGNELLDGVENFQCVVSPTTGLDHLDIKYLMARDIKVIHLGQLKDQIKEVFATAELTWGLLLAVSRHLVTAHQHVSKGLFDREVFLGRELQGRTLGVIGYGRLGKKVSEFGRAFGMTVKITEIDVQKTSELPQGVESVELDRLLDESDVISIHLPLTNETQKYIDERKIAKMKAGAILLNTSRGEILDEIAASHAIESGHLYGVGVDVLSGEVSENFDPLSSPLVLAAKKGFNVVVTPHIGGWAENAVMKTRDLVAEALIESMLKV